MTSTIVHPGAMKALLDWYATLTPESVQDVARFYIEDAYFTDPFNSVRGHLAIRAIFEHMFDTIEAPRFAIQSHLTGPDEGFVTWLFTGAIRGSAFSVPGCSHLRFAEDGRVRVHCDYWDAAALWRDMPVIGAPVRWLQRRCMTRTDV